MSYRNFCIPGIVFLGIAFILQFLVSISLPSLKSFDISRMVYTAAGTSLKQELRFGIWGICGTGIFNKCEHLGHAYELTSFNLQNGKIVTVPASYTRGLAIHPVVAVVTFIAFLLSFSSHITVTLLASLTSFLAALLALIAFAIDLALDLYLHNKRKDWGASVVDAGPGFWLNIVTLILLLLAGCTVCFGRRRHYGSDAEVQMKTFSPGGFISRFRR